jgi:hypothetical protein
MSAERKETDIAWAAGIFEGEGTIGKNGGKGRRSRQVIVAMSDLDVLEKLQQVLGVGAVRGPYLRDVTRKPMYAWRVSARQDVQSVLNALLPYLGERRTAQARESLIFYQVHPANLHTSEAARRGWVTRRAAA